MTKILEKMYPAIMLGVALMLVLAVLFHSGTMESVGYWSGAMVFLHVLNGIVWIGLLYYFNLVQIPTMPKIPAELKPAVGKYIAPEALFWFRWAALGTVITGLLVAVLKGYGHHALLLENGYTTIGVGMWLALVMAFNVWFIIWPNQKKALGIVVVDDAAKAKAARVAMLTSRTNFVLSIPMLYCMITQGLVG